MGSSTPSAASQEKGAGVVPNHLTKRKNVARLRDFDRSTHRVPPLAQGYKEIAYKGSQVENGETRYVCRLEPVAVKNSLVNTREV